MGPQHTRLFFVCSSTLSLALNDCLWTGRALYWRGLRPRLWVLCVECFASRTTDEIAQACVVGTCFMGIYAFVCFVFVRGALRASEIIISQSTRVCFIFFCWHLWWGLRGSRPELRLTFLQQKSAQNMWRGCSREVDVGNLRVWALVWPSIRPRDLCGSEVSQQWLCSFASTITSVPEGCSVVLV